MSLFAYTTAANFPNPSTPDGNVEDASNKIWGSVVLIVQMFSFGAIVFAGIRYMFASANTRADIKKSLAILVLGSIIVFAASTLVKFIVDAANQVMS